MSYPLINGAAINGDEGGQTTAGIDLVAAGTYTAYSVLLAADMRPLELGIPGIRFLVKPTSLDLVRSGTHAAFYNIKLAPQGIGLVTAGAAKAGHYYAPEEGARPLELGAHRAQIGVDVRVRPDGVDLVRPSLHSAMAGQPPPNIVVVAAGANPLEMGAPTASLGTITVDAISVQPLELGAPGAAVALPAKGAHVLEMGGFSTSFIVLAQSARPMEMGFPGGAFQFSVEGLDLVAQGGHHALAGPSIAFANGARVLELGAPGMPTATVYARQSFPFRLGQPSVDRGASC